MLKVLLLIDCDTCRRLFEFSRTASEDTAAWRLHGKSLVGMAEDSGWAESDDGNFHYCPSCSDDMQKMFLGQ